MRERKERRRKKVPLSAAPGSSYSHNQRIYRVSILFSAPLLCCGGVVREKIDDANTVGAVVYLLLLGSTARICIFSGYCKLAVTFIIYIDW